MNIHFLSVYFFSVTHFYFVSMESLQQSMTKLNKLQASGIITTAEYHSFRNNLLDRFVGQPSGPSPRRSSDMDKGTKLPEDPKGHLYRRSCTVKVQPLPTGTTKEILADALRQFGTIESVIVNSGEPMYGYVNFTTPTAARAAKVCRTTTVMGSAVQIRLGKRRKPTTAEAEPTNGIGLFNLPLTTTEEELVHILSQQQGFQEVRLVKRKNGVFRGYAFAYFDNTATALVAKEMLTGLTLKNQTIDVKFASQTSEAALAKAAEGERRSPASPENMEGQ